MACVKCGSDDPKVMRPRGPGQRYCDGEFHTLQDPYRLPPTPEERREFMERNQIASADQQAWDEPGTPASEIGTIDEQAWNDAWAEYYAEQEWPQEIAARIGEAMWLARQDHQPPGWVVSSLIVDADLAEARARRADEEYRNLRISFDRRNDRIRYLTSSRERWIATAGVSWVVAISALVLAFLSATP